MKVATYPLEVLVRLRPSSDFELKLVETMLGFRIVEARTAPVLELRSEIPTAEVTPNEGSPTSLFQTVLRLPFETAVDVSPAFAPGSCDTPATSAATAPASCLAVGVMSS